MYNKREMFYVETERESKNLMENTLHIYCFIFI
jgi:hypothetical protein